MNYNSKVGVCVVAAVLVVVSISGCNYPSAQNTEASHIAQRLNPAGSSASLPSDAELESVFRKHEADFDKLAETAKEDAKLWRISSDRFEVFDEREVTRVGTDGDMNQERRKEYRQLFTELNLEHGLIKTTHPFGETVHIAASVRNFGVDSDEKGYAYITGEPSPIYDTLDDKQKTGGDPSPLFRRLKGNWYLYYQYNE